MAAQKKLHSIDEYLAQEEHSEIRHEYIAGEVYAMAGGSLEHSLITVNCSGELRLLLRGSGCIVLSPDIKVRAGSAFLYPDVTVVCGDPEFFEGRDDVICNPLVIVEVLSPSTESFDRGGKFARYRRIELLQAYVMLSQSEAKAERYERQGNQWVLTEFEGPDASLELASLNISVSLAALYENVALPGPPAE
jgi:Uma2 family endonuclease